MNSIQNKIVLLATSLGAFIFPFMASSVNIALPSISEEFYISSVLLNWIPLSFTLATAIFVLPFGRLADIFGKRKLLMLGMTCFSIFSLICGFAVNPIMLVVGRSLQGVCAASIAVTVVSILTSVFPAGKRGKALGLNVAMTYIGLSTGPYLGGLLTSTLGWRSLFYFSTIIGVIVVLPLLTVKHDWAEAKGEKFDFKGSILYAIALLGIISGLSFINTFFGPIFIGVGIIALIIFGVFESKISAPILNMSIFKGNKVVIFSSLAALINYSATFALSYLLSLYLQYNLGYSPSHAGLVLIAQPIVMALFSPIAGFLSDKIEPQKVASLGMILTTIGLSFFIFISENTHIIYVVCGLLILGFGFALFSSPNTNAIMSSVDKRFFGITSGIIGGARTIGQALSMGIASLILVIYMGNAQINVENSSNLIEPIKVTFVILTLLCFLGIFASIARGKMKK